MRRRINVLNDHVAVYYPEHFQVICDRIGAQLTEMYLFDHKRQAKYGQQVQINTLQHINTTLHQNGEFVNGGHRK